MIGGQRRMTAVLVGMEGNVDVPVGMEVPGKPAGIEDEIVAFRLPAFELDLRASLHSLDVEHLRVDVTCARAFVQQVRQQIRGQVIGRRTPAPE